MQNFVERVTDFAIRNGYEVSEAGFDQAMNDYVEGWKGTLERFNSNPKQITKLMFARGLNKAMIT